MMRLARDHFVRSHRPSKFNQYPSAEYLAQEIGTFTAFYENISTQQMPLWKAILSQGFMSDRAHRSVSLFSCFPPTLLSQKFHR
jgi:hypothetical protein